MSKHIPKEELKHDEFVEFSHKLATWATANRTLLIVGFAAIVLVIAGVTFSRHYASGLKTERSTSFNDALNAYGKAMSATEPAERESQMATAESLFRSFSADYTGPLADLAVYMVGDTYYNRGVAPEHFEKAADAYRDYVRRATAPADKAMGNLALGYAQESLAFLSNEPAEATAAVASYQEAERLAGNTWLGNEAKLARARVLSGMPGREDEALRLATEVEKARAYKPPFEPVKPDAGPENDRKLLRESTLVINQFGLSRSAEFLRERIESALAQAESSEG